MPSGNCSSFKTPLKGRQKLIAEFIVQTIKLSQKKKGRKQNG